MTSIKKVFNDPRDVAAEALEGLALAYHGRATLLPEHSSLVRSSIAQGKVGLLVGGGSGHEPLFAGFVGERLADGAVCGNVFAAPAPDKILGATQAVNRGSGVLYLYGNYAGDNMNFDIAAELAAERGIATRTVRVWDDIASAPPERVEQRRGIAGDVFVIKIAGSAAAVESRLDDVYRIACKARDHTRSLGVALAPGSIPETGELTFQLGPDELEVGMGLHGEQGVARRRMLPADALVDMMMERIVADLPFRQGQSVCLLINNLGASTPMELLIVNRRAHQYLKKAGLVLHDSLIGAYCTSQEMAGFSISLLALDSELQAHYDAAASSFALTRAGP